MNDTGKLVAIIAKGKARFVVLNGALLFGVPAATLALLIRLALGGDLTVVSIGSSYLMFPLAGLFWGLFMWSHLRKRLQRLRQEQTDLTQSEQVKARNSE
ncbi:MAG: hypothetical protein ACLFOA_06840 [Desulfohalobiaceae bacterium]